MNINDFSFDNYHIWHPYTSITDPLPVYPIKSAFGFELVLSDGRHLIDGMSSWWTTIHGYNHPIINQAIINQINNMSHVMFGGITHSPAIELCRRLIKLTPNNLECIFLADSGSVSIEVAIKMALQYWQACGEKRKKILTLKNGYHGDTFGAISVSDPCNSMHNLYSNYFPSNQLIDTPRNFYDIWNKDDDFLLNKTFDTYHNILAAVILEPIVLGAGGMKFYHPEYLRCIRKLCNNYKILLIIDEIATGFGRTGKWFAYNHANIVPDILCIGKALTGGALTLSATLTSRHLAETISNSEARCLMHGPTFMANPLACSAANASLFLLENENWNERIKNINTHLKDGLLPLSNHFQVYNVRVLGAIGVVETIKKINIAKIQKWFVDHGVWIRPFGKLIYLIPPYIISSSALEQLISVIESSLNQPKHFIN